MPIQLYFSSRLSVPDAFRLSIEQVDESEQIINASTLVFIYVQCKEDEALHSTGSERLQLSIIVDCTKYNFLCTSASVKYVLNIVTDYW